MFIFPSRILSLDMGNYSYKFIEAQLSDRIQILRYGLCQEIRLFNSNSPIKMWKKYGCRSKNVILSYHHKSLITREIELNANDELELQIIIEEEFQKYQSELKEEYDFDYIIQPHNSESGSYLTKTAGISKRINREYIDKAMSLGLRPIAVDIQINAFIRVIKEVLESNEEFSGLLPCLVLDLGYQSTTAAIVDIDEIKALKCIPIGCNIIDESLEEKDNYLREITMLCSQMIDHYIYSTFSEDLTHGILYGGGALDTSIISYLIDLIPLRWNHLNFFHRFLPEIPAEMDLNLYANCIGSLYQEEEKLKRERK